jgi:undecaprenyl diphosphate synthase
MDALGGGPEGNGGARAEGPGASERAPLDGDGPPSSLPGHVAIIMDGNGRWAEERHLPRFQGHRTGVESVRAVTRECARLKIRELTLYAFSTENWRRPPREVEFLMDLLRHYVVRERQEMMENDIRFRCIGRIEALPAAVVEHIEETKALTANNKGLVLRLALNYGGRMEILDAVRRIAAEAKVDPTLADRLDEETFCRYLYDVEMTDPDLLIRTSGEMRISNYLLWQSSYTEFYFTDTHWPDFRVPELHRAFRAFAQRQRRFGAISPAEAKPA